MFTGIIEEIGTIKSVLKGAHSSQLSVRANVIFDDLKIGDSVAVNGSCLTVTEIHGNVFKADVMHETLNRTSIENLKSGSRVNLERAMPANGRFGGHIVSGHIDGTGVVSKITRDDTAVILRVRTDAKILRYIVEKGSITIEGTSLTVVSVSDTDFSVSIIPHTALATTLLEKKVGDIVNLENDIIAKYVEKLCMGSTPSGGGITKEFLEKYGF